MSESIVFKSRIISTEDEFIALHSHWDALVQSESVFLLHEWFSAAWEWAKYQSKLCVIVVERNGDLVGIFPLVRRHDTVAGLPIVVLEFLSIPDTQECDVICAAECRNEVALQLATKLAHDPDWHILRLDRLRPDSFVVKYLRRQFSSVGVEPSVTRIEENLTLPLDCTWDEFYSRRSRRLKKGNNLIANRLAKNFESIEVVSNRLADHDSPDRESVVQDLISVSSRSWKGKDTETTFAETGPRAFIEKLCSDARISQYVYVWRLLLNTKCVATELQLVKDGVIYALRSDFDASYQQQSPGTFLNKEILQGLFDEDLSEYRMGPGSNAYKLRWSEKQIDLYELLAYSRNVKGRYAYVLKRLIKPLVEKLRSSGQQLFERLTIFAQKK